MTMGADVHPNVSLDDVDVVVKTFVRPDKLSRLLDSIERYYPGVCVHIADDSPASETTSAYHQTLTRRGHVVHRLPFDVGVSVGRNHLVDVTSRPFVLLLDDDFVFAESTRIESLLEVAHLRPDVGVIAGLVVDLGGGGIDRGARRFRLDDRRVLHLLPALHTEVIAGHRCQPADMVGNFGLFRRSMLETVRWDASLKIYEHLEFFLRVAQSKWGVLGVPAVVVGHDVERVRGYTLYRHDRAALYREQSLSKAGVLAVCSHMASRHGARRSMLVAHLEATVRAVASRQWRCAAEVAWVALRQVEPTGAGLIFALKGARGVLKRRGSWRRAQACPATGCAGSLR